ncbi:MAG: glycosyltransferase family 4 protein, partial [Gaiellaceae bacterium]
MTMERTVPILFVHHRPELGGAPESLAYLIRELDRDRFEPHVYCPPGAAAALFRQAGATVHTGPVAGFTHIWASTYRGRRWLLLGRELARLPAHLRGLSRTLRAADFALVHLNDSPPVAAGWVARRAGLPVVWHLRSALPETEGPRRSRALRTAIARLSSRSLAINDDVAASFALDSAVMLNAVDLDRFHPGDPVRARTELDLPPDRPVVSTFGFLYPSKGVHVFLEAAAAVRARGLDATYLLVGGGVRDRAFFASTRGRLLRLAGL